MSVTRETPDDETLQAWVADADPRRPWPAIDSDRSKRLSELACAAPALAAEVLRLRAIVEGRTTPPTEAENAAHLAAGGAWLVVWQWREGVPVAEIAWGKHVCDDDRPKDARWIALDAARRPCLWPEVAR